MRTEVQRRDCRAGLAPPSWSACESRTSPGTRDKRELQTEAAARPTNLALSAVRARIKSRRLFPPRSGPASLLGAPTASCLVKEDIQQRLCNLDRPSPRGSAICCRRCLDASLSHHSIQQPAPQTLLGKKARGGTALGGHGQSRLWHQERFRIRQLQLRPQVLANSARMDVSAAFLRLQQLSMHISCCLAPNPPSPTPHRDGSRGANVLFNSCDYGNVLPSRLVALAHQRDAACPQALARAQPSGDCPPQPIRTRRRRLS